MSVPDDFWTRHADSLQKVRRILLRVRDLLPTLDEIDGPTVVMVMEEATPILKPSADPG